MSGVQSAFESLRERGAGGEVERLRTMTEAMDAERDSCQDWAEADASRLTSPYNTKQHLSVNRNVIVLLGD